mgnify:CR=1 FL=1
MKDLLEGFKITSLFYFTGFAICCVVTSVSCLVTGDVGLIIYLGKMVGKYWRFYLGAYIMFGLIITLIT